MAYPLSRVVGVMKPCNPKATNPMHVRKLEAALEGRQYIAEEKFDGCRYMSIGGMMFSSHISRQTGEPVDKTAQLYPIAGTLIDRSSCMILDGEVVLPGGKAPEVVSIAGCLPDEAQSRQMETPLHYMVFDMLRTPDGEWLINCPWLVRHARLLHWAKTVESDLIHIVPVVEEDKRAFLDQMLSEGHEGIILKHKQSSYHPGKRPMWEWIKVKVQSETDVVIMDFEEPTRVYTGKNQDGWPYWEDGEPVTKPWAKGWIGSFAFGQFDLTGRLCKLGTCSGMTEEVRADMSSYPDQYLYKVAKVQFMEKTKDGALRHPRFLEMHPDKMPEECILE